MPSKPPRPPRGHLTASNRAEICVANICLDYSLGDFIEHVSSAREESLSQYLFWRWRQLDKLFHYQRISPTTPYQEDGIGADFLLELWLAGPTAILPLLIQAKKFVNPGGYENKLLYRRGTGDQLDKLMAWSHAFDFFPCYLIYVDPKDPAAAGHTLHLIAADEIVKLVIGGGLPPTPAMPLLLKDILPKGVPLYNLFCLDEPHLGAKLPAPLAAFMRDLLSSPLPTGKKIRMSDSFNSPRKCA